MQAVIYRADRAPVADIDRPGPHQVYRRPRLAIEARALGAAHVRGALRLVGVCGSDLHLMQCDPTTGDTVGSAPLEVGPEGRILGHEAVGQVREVGAGVSGIERAERVRLAAAATAVVDGLDALRRALEAPVELARTQCTLLARL